MSDVQKRIRSRKTSFSLVEMLVVIAVIGILIGFVFKMMQYIERRQRIAQCLEKLERLGCVLEEYKSCYGEYPPVKPGVCAIHGDRMCYVYEFPGGQNDYIRQDYLKKNDRDLWRYGLVAYIAARSGHHGIPGFEHTSYVTADGVGHPNSSYIADTSRDVDEKQRWTRFLFEPDDIIGYNNAFCFTNPGSYTHVVGMWYTSLYATICDPWGGIINYESTPPYLSYKLWSNGGEGSGPLHRDHMWDE